MKKLALILPLVLLLAGCGDSDVKEVKDWMDQTKAQSKPNVPPISEPKTFVPFAYNEKDATDPFSQQKLLVELAKAAASSNSPYKPDMNRRKEPLEAYPLDTVRMVGALQKGGVTYGLIQIDRSVYQVRPGMHLGQNYGLITSVTEDAINIKEIVQDAAGEWTERMAKLELQESKEKSK